MDSCTWMCQSWLTNNDLLQLCAGRGGSLKDLSRVMDEKNGWQRESGSSVLSIQLDYIYI